MSEMIERAARAIWLVGEDWDTKASFDLMPDYGKEFWCDRASAAIEAMREPSAAMIEAGFRARVPGMTMAESAAATWSAMIAAALTASRPLSEGGGHV